MFDRAYSLGTNQCHESKYIPEASNNMEEPTLQKLEQTSRSGGLRKSSKFVFKLVIKTLGLGVSSADCY